jgi:hypothetical protein
MIVLAILGGITVAGIAAATVYDRRVRRRGGEVGVSLNAGFQNRTDVSAMKSEPFVHHDKHD